MKTPFKFLIFALSFLLLGVFSTANVAAIIVYGEISDGVTTGPSIETSNISSVYFDANVFSMTPNIKEIHIGLYNQAGTEMQVFCKIDNYGSDLFDQRFTISRLDDGTYTIYITAKDEDGISDTATLTLKVSKANIPVLEHISDISVVVKENVIITPTADDAAGSTMTYSISSPNVDSGDYNWDGTTFTWKPRHEGTYSFTVTASNGNYADTETFTITVEDIENVLSINSLNLSQIQVSPGDVISVTVEIQNEGNVDETGRIVYVKIPALGISAQSSEFALNKADTITKTLQIVIPSTAAEGTYLVTATTVSDSTSKTISIKAKTPTIIIDTGTGTNETVTPVVPQTSGISTEMIIFSEVLIILIVCIIIYASKRKKIEVINEFA